MVSFHAALAALLLSNPGQTVLLDFYTDWCGSCRAMEPAIQALQEKGYPVQKVNAEKNPELAAQFGVHSYPTYIMLVDGKKVDGVIGTTTFSRLERMCKIKSSLQGQDRSPGLLARNPALPEAPPPAPSVSPASWTVAGSPAGRDYTNVMPASLQTPVGAMTAEKTSPLDAKIIAASVRLRIEDPNGNSCGSGTIIDARGGDALILTCGHIFRDSQGKGRINVELFGPYAGQRAVGKLISYDLKRDVGLLFIKAPGPIAAVRMAPPGSQVRKGDRVLSAGCDNGNDPAVHYSYVASLNRYTGPPNLQVAGQPTEGRSGGGLFSADGTLIGVCNARDPQDQEGFYAALETVSAQLDEADMAYVYQLPKGYEGSGGASPLMAGTTLPPMSRQPVIPALAASMPGVVPANPEQSSAAAGISPSALNPGEQAAMDEIHRRLKEGAEVVCIVRSRRNPQGKSEVIMLDRASPEFIQQLAAEAQSQQVRQETSLELPLPKSPTLEWSSGPNPNSKAWRQGQ